MDSTRLVVSRVLCCSVASALVAAPQELLGGRDRRNIKGADSRVARPNHRRFKCGGALGDANAGDDRGSAAPRIGLL